MRSRSRCVREQAGRLLYGAGRLVEWSQTENPATLVGTTTAACTGRTAVLREHETQIRVRYQDADPMGLLHHANYFTYFEIGRTELLRSARAVTTAAWRNRARSPWS